VYFLLPMFGEGMKMWNEGSVEGNQVLETMVRKIDGI
jgi:hypothetical protein